MGTVSQFQVINQLRLPLIILVTYAHSYNEVAEGYSLLESGWDTYQVLKLVVSQTLVKAAMPYAALVPERPDSGVAAYTYYIYRGEETRLVVPDAATACLCNRHLGHSTRTYTLRRLLLYIWGIHGHKENEYH